MVDDRWRIGGRLAGRRLALAGDCFECASEVNMDTLLAWAAIIGLILLEPVTMAYAWHYARREGWL